MNTYTLELNLPFPFLCAQAPKPRRRCCSKLTGSFHINCNIPHRQAHKPPCCNHSLRISSQMNEDCVKLTTKLTHIASVQIDLMIPFNRHCLFGVYSISTWRRSNNSSKSTASLTNRVLSEPEKMVQITLRGSGPHSYLDDALLFPGLHSAADHKYPLYSLTGFMH